MTALSRVLAACRLLLVAACVLLLPAASSMALEVPELKGRVNDYAAMLAPATVAQLENSLGLFEQQQSTQIVVLTVASLAGDSLEDFSLRVAETWRIGQKGKDNGALLVIARDDRKMRIEVGYGLEGALTDLEAGRIIRNVITPQFRNGNFDQGVTNGLTAMMAAVKGEFAAGQDESPQRYTDLADRLTVPLLLVLFFFNRIFGRHAGLTAAVGGLAAPILGLFAFGLQWAIILALIPVGLAVGFLLAVIAGAAGHRGSGGLIGGGGFGGSSGGFGGGFSGGGGGFGGGGASGGW